MQKAWIKYNTTNLSIEGISWEKTGENFVEISKDLAVELLNGNEQLVMYQIIKTSTNEYNLEKIKNIVEIPKFWNLSDFEKESVKLEAIDNSIIIRNNNKNKTNFKIYITLMNQPSWLIKTLEVKIDYCSTEIIEFLNANKFSYYLGITS